MSLIIIRKTKRTPRTPFHLRWLLAAAVSDALFSTYKLRERETCGTHIVNINLSYTWMCARVYVISILLAWCDLWWCQSDTYRTRTCISGSCYRVYRNIENSMRIRTRPYLLYLVNARANVFLCKLKTPFRHWWKWNSTHWQKQKQQPCAIILTMMMESHSFPKPNFTKIESAHTHTKWMMIFSTNLYYMCYNMASIPTSLSFNIFILLSIFVIWLHVCGTWYNGVYCWSNATIIHVRISIL